jgi:hypothetical protein
MEDLLQLFLAKQKEEWAEALGIMEEEAVDLQETAQTALTGVPVEQELSIRYLLLTNTVRVAVVDKIYSLTMLMMDSPIQEMAGQAGPREIQVIPMEEMVGQVSSLFDTPFCATIFIK